MNTKSNNAMRKDLLYCCTIVSILFLLFSTASVAQDISPAPLPYDPAYAAQGDNLARADGDVWRQDLPISGPAVAGPSDLEVRLAEVEKALKKIESKAKEDKKKAAEKPSVAVIGRAYLDTVAFGQNDQSRAIYGDARDTTFFRSGRIGAQGNVFETWVYKIEVDFAARDSQDLSLVALRDVYLQVKELPLLQNVRVGHFKEPLSLEELTSSRFITFMERSMPNAFIPAFNSGVATFGYTENERTTWSIGAFAAGQDTPPYVAEDSTQSGDGTAGTGRITWTPWYDEDYAGRRLLHLGIGYRYCHLFSSTQRVRARAETGVGPYVVDTRIGAIDTLTNVQNSQTLVPEIALVLGPFSVQAEYMTHTYTRDAGFTNPVFNGGYVFVSYFLTGENRAYNRKEGRFERVKPLENFFRIRGDDGYLCTGIGAWELAYRYSWIDLDEAGIFGGIASDHTFGVNWYLTPYSRLMFNYIHSVDSPNGGRDDTFLDVFAMRAQFDF